METLILNSEESQRLRKRLTKNAKKADSGCWEWQLALDRYGYGKFSYKHRTYKAHRISFLVFKPEEWDPNPLLHICHTCDNRKCVNPSHLFLGTHIDNIQDRMQKGRKSGARREQHGNSKLSEKDVEEIKALAQLGFTDAAIAECFPVGRSAIRKITSGANWSD